MEKINNILTEINEQRDGKPLTEDDIKLGTFIVGRVKVGAHWMKKKDFLELQVPGRPHPQKFQVCDIDNKTKLVKIVSLIPGAKPLIVPFDKFN